MRKTISLCEGLIPVGNGKRRYENGSFIWTGKTKRVPTLTVIYDVYLLELEGRSYRMIAGKNLEDGYVMLRGSTGKGLLFDDTYDIFDTQTELMAEFARITKRAESIKRDPEAWRVKAEKEHNENW